MKTQNDPKDVLKWVFASEWLPVPSAMILTPRLALLVASERWPIKSKSWRDSNPHVRGIEFTNATGKRQRRVWADFPYLT